MSDLALYVVQFHDKPNTQDVREAFMKAHLAWIEKNRSWVLLAGSLREEQGMLALGGLWVVAAESKADVLEKINTDPFWANGVRGGVEVFFWGMALADMKALPSLMASLRENPGSSPT